jgi:predicted amidohydrolase YtcJ
MRFRASLYIDPSLGASQVKRLINERSKHSGDLFKIISGKIFIDGVVEGTTALLKEPYNHIPNFYGQLLWDLDSLNNIREELGKNNFQIHVHAIGDSAVNAALNAFEFSKNESDLRHSITHLQMASMEDIVRFRELGVIAIPQPYWFKKDSYYTDIQVPYLGQKRADKEYPMASFFNEGVIVASSSDYPVTIPCNPFIAIQTGITRSEPNNSDPTNILWPEESVTLEQMIASFTINGAYANFVEHITGSIEIGKSADLIVIDSDLFKMPLNNISKTKVLQTIFKGKVVFRDSSYTPLIL